MTDESYARREQMKLAKAAKRVIALKWKEIQGPTLGQWITELSSNLALEKLTYMARGKAEDFNKMWLSFLTFMNNLNVQPRTGQDLLLPPLWP